MARPKVPQRRVAITISIPANPDGMVILDALKDIPERERSATLVSWVAAYLQGRAREHHELDNTEHLNTDALESLLDDF